MRAPLLWQKKLFKKNSSLIPRHDRAEIKAAFNTGFLRGLEFFGGDYKFTVWLFFLRKN